MLREHLASLLFRRFGSRVRCTMGLWADYFREASELRMWDVFVCAVHHAHLRTQALGNRHAAKRKDPVRFMFLAASVENPQRGTYEPHRISTFVPDPGMEHLWADRRDYTQQRLPLLAAAVVQGHSLWNLDDSMPLPLSRPQPERKGIHHGPQVPPWLPSLQHRGALPSLQATLVPSITVMKLQPVLRSCTVQHIHHCDKHQNV